jgi:CubicO group peptidase (beta-lactamase class C family)
MTTSMKLTVMSLFVATGLLTTAAPNVLDMSAARHTARQEATRALGRPVAGIQIAVAHDGSLVFVDSFGLADAAGHRPVTNDTVFHLASISKNILAAVVVRLAEQHRLSLDDDVTKYVATAPTHGVRITVRQLLNHTSGLYSFTSRSDAEANEQKVLSHEQVIGLFKDQPLDFPPGSSWRYDNSAFYLAGMVVEAVTGRLYADYIRDEVFRALGMTSSSLCGAHDIPGMASGHDVVSGALTATSITWSLPFAAGAVCATAADLVRWQSALESGRFISQQSLAMMRSPTVLADGSRIDYGLGSRIGAIGRHAIFGHTGGGGGFATILMTVPDAKLTVVVLTNTATAPPYDIAELTIRAALRELRQPLLDLDAPADELAAIAGMYDSDEGRLEFFACGRKLCHRMPDGSTPMAALRQGLNRYNATPGIEARFDPTHGAPWAFVYEGGLFMDAKRRIR